MTVSQAEHPRYNKVFETLVSGREDLVGLIAYALYKWHKREWLLRLREKREPTGSDEEAFLATVFADIDSYGERAKEVLAKYGEVYVEDARPQIERQAIQGRMEDAAERVERAGHWGRQIVTGVASSVATTVVFVLLAIGLQAAGIDLIDILNRIHPGGSTPGR
jgi:hypothetical protein